MQIRVPARFERVLTRPSEFVFSACSLDYSLALWLSPARLIALLAHGTLERAEREEARLLRVSEWACCSAAAADRTTPHAAARHPEHRGTVLIGALFADVWSRVRQRAVEAPLLWVRVLLTLPCSSTTS